MGKKRDDVSALIPHHGSYRFVDELVSYGRGEGVVCRKEIRGDEPYFAGHFPGHPIVPGVFEIEMMLQAASLFLALEREGGGNEEVGLARIDNARFLKPIIPPAVLTITVEAKGTEQSLARFSGHVGDETQQYVRASFSVERIRP